MRTCRKWTDEEKQYLIDNGGNLTDKEFAEELNRTPNAVRRMRCIMGIPAPHKKPIYEILRGYEVLATGTADECSEKTGYKRQTIMFYASKSHHERVKDLDKSVIAIRVD